MWLQRTSENIGECSGRKKFYITSSPSESEMIIRFSKFPEMIEGTDKVT